MLFHQTPEMSKEYMLLSPVYDVNDPGEEALMDRRQALRAARYFLAAVDDPETPARVVNTTSGQVYEVRRLQEDTPVFLVTWANGNC